MSLNVFSTFLSARFKVAVCKLEAPQQPLLCDHFHMAELPNEERTMELLLRFRYKIKSALLFTRDTVIPSVQVCRIESEILIFCSH